MDTIILRGFVYSRIYCVHSNLIEDDRSKKIYLLQTMKMVRNDTQRLSKKMPMLV